MTISKPRKLLSLAVAPMALASALAGCAGQGAATRTVVQPAPIMNAAGSPAAETTTVATPMCDAEGRPLPGNVRNGELGCPAHPASAAPQALSTAGSPAVATPMLGADGRPLPGNVGTGKGMPRAPKP